MSDEELADALDGLFAYDNGSTDSGIRDEALRQRCRVEIARDLGPGQMFSARVSRIARRLFLDDEQIAKGYGLEDVRRFAEWIENGLVPT